MSTSRFRNGFNIGFRSGVAPTTEARWIARFARRLHTGRALTALCALASLVYCLPAHSLAQEIETSTLEDSLRDIETLAAIGRTTEAREEIADWWDVRQSGTSLRLMERALWLRGRLQLNPDDAARDFRRLVAEFPSGPYADLALLRLIQGATALGNTESEQGYLETLSRAYPGTPGHQGALAWVRGEEVRAGSGFESFASLSALTTAQADPALVDLPLSDDADLEAAADPTMESAADEMVEDGAAVEGSDPVAEPADEISMPFSVQLGAFRDRVRAERLETQARDRGFDPRIARLPESQLQYVRIGRFATEAEADSLQRELTELGFSGFVVRDAEEELPSG